MRLSLRKNTANPFRVIKDLIQITILFFFLFEIPIAGPITTRRAACACALIYVLIFRSRWVEISENCNIKKLRRFLLSLFLCFTISAINYLFYPQTSLIVVYCGPHFYVYEFLFIYIFGIYVFLAFGDENDFFLKYIAVIMIQTVSVYIAAFNRNVRMYFYENFYTGDDRFGLTVSTGKRIMGIGLHSSMGSLILFSGCIALVVMRRKRYISATVFSILYTLVLGSTFLIGRTGFYFSIVLFLFYTLLSSDKSKTIYSGILVALFATYGLFLILSKMNANVASRFMAWSFEIFNEETRFDTINTLREMPFPKFSMQSFFGTNILRGITTNGTVIRNDSGYVEMIGGLGYIGSFIYFSGYLNLFTAPNFERSNTKSKLFSYFFIASIFIYEIKEPCILRYDVAMMIFVVLLHDAKTRRVLE